MFKYVSMVYVLYIVKYFVYHMAVLKIDEIRHRAMQGPFHQIFGGLFSAWTHVQVFSFSFL